MSFMISLLLGLGLPQWPFSCSGNEPVVLQRGVRLRSAAPYAAWWLHVYPRSVVAVGDPFCRPRAPTLLFAQWFLGPDVRGVHEPVQGHAHVEDHLGHCSVLLVRSFISSPCVGLRFVAVTMADSV